MITEAVITKAIGSLIDKFIVPKFQILEKELNINIQLLPKKNLFEEYLKRSYEKLSIINTLVLRNSQRELQDIYIPLTIMSKTIFSNKQSYYTINSYDIDLINNYKKKILISDSAGMGKSTILKRIFLDVIEKKQGIPVFIELRRLSSERTLLDYIYEEINSLSMEFDKEMLKRLIEKGNFIFFFDGYDEVSSTHRDAVTKDVQNFISKANKNVFFLTSRPEESLLSFGDFQEFSILGLTFEEICSLLKKYDNNGETSSLLIKVLKSGKYKILDEFLKNPLLASLLFTAYDSHKDIPIKKHQFYENIYNAYFENHDLTKPGSYIHEKESKLDRQNFLRILRTIGFICFFNEGIEFTENQIISIIKEAKSGNSDLLFSEEDYLKDLLKTVPLFCKEGLYYRWVHRSLQEYYAALYIYQDINEEKKSFLSRLYHSSNIEKYLNLLDFYEDIDTQGFEENFELPLLNEFINSYKKNIIKSNIIPKESMEIRFHILWGKQINMYINDDDKTDFLNQDYSNENITINIKENSKWLTLSPIIQRKHRYLFFIDYDRRQCLVDKFSKDYSDSKMDLKSLLEEKQFTLTISTGENSRELYDYLSYLTIDVHNIWKNSLILEKCKEEIQRIKKNKTNKKSKITIYKNIIR